MPREHSKAVPDGDGPVPHHDEFGGGEPTMADLYRMLEESFDKKVDKMRSHFDQQDKKLNELTEMMRATNARLADL